MHQQVTHQLARAVDLHEERVLRDAAAIRGRAVAEKSRIDITSAVGDLLVGVPPLEHLGHAREHARGDVARCRAAWKH